MPRLRTALLTLLLLCCALAGGAQIKPIWTTSLAPFRIADNLYYVGSRDLAAYLVTTPDGNILINANLPSSPPQIRASVEQLGLRWQDTRILLVAHDHFDHAGGSAQILRETHARLMVMEYDADVVESGGKTDFLFRSGSVAAFPPAHVDRVLHDGDTVSLGGVTLTAHRTGGHTRGCTTWTMQTHLAGEPAAKLRNVVIVGGYTMWSDYQLRDTPGHPSSYPGIADDFRRTFALLRSLPCDLFLAAHGEQFGMLEKLKHMPQQGEAVWIDPQGYSAMIDTGERLFQHYLADQEKAAAKP